MYCITYSNVYYMEACLKWINFQGSSDSTTCRLCSIIRTSNYIQLPVHLHCHKYYYHACNGLTVHQSCFFTKKENYLGTEMPIQQWNITATLNRSLFRLIVWKGHPLIAIPEEFCFTITTALLEILNVTQPVKKYLAPSLKLKANS